MQTTKEYIDILKQYKQQVAERYGILAMGIFGSVARGEHHPGSDLDIYVCIETPNPFILKHLKKALNIC